MLHRLQNHIPRIITGLGFLYIISPVLYYIYYGILSGKPFHDVGAVLGYAGKAYFVQFLLVMFLTPLVGVGLVLKRKWGLVAFFVYGLALITQSIINYALRPQSFNLGAVIGNIVLICVLLLFVRLELRAPFYRPDWQMRERRFKRVLPVGWGREDGTLQETVTVDISARGCFVAAAELPPLGSRVRIRFRDDAGELLLTGRVCWHSRGNRRFPLGFGVMFDTSDHTPRIEALFSR